MLVVEKCSSSKLTKPPNKPLQYLLGCFLFLVTYKEALSALLGTSRGASVSKGFEEHTFGHLWIISITDNLIYVQVICRIQGNMVAMNSF